MRTHTVDPPSQCLLESNASYLAAAAQDVGQARGGAAGERGRRARGDGGRGADRLGGVAEKRFGDHGCETIFFNVNRVNMGE